MPRSTNDTGCGELGGWFFAFVDFQLCLLDCLLSGLSFCLFGH